MYEQPIVIDHSVGRARGKGCGCWVEVGKGGKMETSVTVNNKNEVDKNTTVFFVAYSALHFDISIL